MKTLELEQNINIGCATTYQLVLDKILYLYMTLKLNLMFSGFCIPIDSESDSQIHII